MRRPQQTFLGRDASPSSAGPPRGGEAPHERSIDHENTATLATGPRPKRQPPFGTRGQSETAAKGHSHKRVCARADRLSPPMSSHRGVAPERVESPRGTDRN